MWFQKITIIDFTKHYYPIKIQLNFFQWDFCDVAHIFHLKSQYKQQLTIFSKHNLNSCNLKNNIQTSKLLKPSMYPNIRQSSYVFQLPINNLNQNSYESQRKGLCWYSNKPRNKPYLIDSLCKAHAMKVIWFKFQPVSIDDAWLPIAEWH